MPITISANYKEAFKPADIRGVYPSEIDEELTYFVARAFVDEYEHKTVLVARDMRLSSPALHSAFVKGVIDAGANVIDLGLVSTPVLYFASGTQHLPGVVITASHSPKQFNGLKLVLADAIPLTEQFGLKQIRKRIEKGVFAEVAKPGKVKTKDVLKAYQKFVLTGVQKKGLSDMRIAVDVGNGMGAVVMPLIDAALPVTFTTLFKDLDGNFPNRGSDPTLKKNQQKLQQELKQKSYDFGIAFDGDADRIAFLDEQGTFINSAAIGAVIAQRLLRKNPKAKIVYTTLTSRIYEETVKASGGVLVPARVGHAFIKEIMRKKDVLFGCEHSGHYYFKEYFFTDSVELTLKYVLEEYAGAKKQGLSFGDMMKPYILYFQTEDVVVDVVDKVKAQRMVEEYLLSKNPVRVKRFDGLFVDYGDVWGAVKISVTEHALKLMFEGKKKAQASALQKEIIAYIKSIAT